MIVFLHGVPETAAIWRKVQDAVGRESVALALPGFGCPRPEGFGATKDEYVAWVLSQLDDVAGPIDLVGHDWGAGLTFRIATAHGERIRSYVFDVANVFHPDYEWHDFAKVWQTPGEGEAAVEAQDAMPVADRAAMFEALGVPGADAREMAGAFDRTMGRSILDLYRSATPNAHTHWGPMAPTVVPGLVLHPADDPFSDEAKAREVAEALGAGFERVEGAGHFWPYQAPEAFVPVLCSFWDSLDRRG